MKLFDATLDLANLCQGIEYHNITSANAAAKQFTCDTLSARLGEFTEGGTVWFTTGNCAGEFATIKRSGNQTITIYDEITGTFAAGDEVAISGVQDFKTSQLINAINHTLYQYPIMSIWSGSIYSHDTPTYTLDATITNDVRRVEIQNALDSDQYVVCHYWDIANRILYIRKPSPFYLEGGLFRIYFVKNHGVIDRNDAIDPAVDNDYLAKKSMLYLWRNVLQSTHKDNMVAADFFNEAKMYENELSKRDIPRRNLMIKDLIARW